MIPSFSIRCSSPSDPPLSPWASNENCPRNSLVIRAFGWDSGVGLPSGFFLPLATVPVCCPVPHGLFPSSSWKGLLNTNRAGEAPAFQPPLAFITPGITSTRPGPSRPPCLGPHLDPSWISPGPHLDFTRIPAGTPVKPHGSHLGPRFLLLTGLLTPGSLCGCMVPRSLPPGDLGNQGS